MVALFIASVIVFLVFVDLGVQLINRKYSVKEPVFESKSLETYEIPGSELSLTLNPPPTYFHSNSHLWLRLLPTGEFMIGIDDLIGKLMGKMERIILPESGKIFKKGDVCCIIEQKNKIAHFIMPFEGIVTLVNNDVNRSLQNLQADHYSNWFFFFKPSNVVDNVMNLQTLKIGSDAGIWLNSEASRIKDFINKHKNSTDSFSSDTLIPGLLNTAEKDLWNDFESRFLMKS
jgi:glycine cleavage system H lipoate-binding protein